MLVYQKHCGKTSYKVRKDCATLTSHKVVSGIYKEPLEN
jgi:hypothetical protein